MLGNRKKKHRKGEVVMDESAVCSTVQNAGEQPGKRKMGISGSTLKWIALITMLIDHIGTAVVGRMVLISNGATIENPQVSAFLPNGLFAFYMLMRFIGRIAFPIYCFLMVEGFMRTHNKWKYAVRLGVFALISEIPFDLTFSSKILEFSYQNVFFTLLCGLLAMIVVDVIERRVCSSKNHFVNRAVYWLLAFTVVAAFALLAEVMNTDYGAIGVACIMMLYFFRKNKIAQIVAGCVAFCWEFTAPLAFIPIAFYNGERGIGLKYFFYLFYPLHLFILYLVCVCMGIAGIPAL